MAGLLEPTVPLREMPLVHDHESSAGTTTMPVQQLNIMATGRMLDVAINGAGVFVFVDDTNRAVYSRSGRLDVDRDGHLVHAEGWRLAGRVDLAGPDDIARELPPLSYAMPGRQATRFDLKMNLPADKAARDPASSFSPQDFNAFSATSSVTLYDANGAAVGLGLHFLKVATDRWEVFASALPNEAAWLIATLDFQPDGRLIALHSAPFDVPATSDGPNGPTLTIPKVVFGGEEITQNFAPFSSSPPDTDGHPQGQLVRVEVTTEGLIAAHYDNGEQKPVGQALLARFALADRLLRVGNTGLRCVSQCGAPIVAPPGYMVLGTLVTGALEEGF
jgi:flagellar hook protein FlgE